jgi:hypothetical protein
MPFLCAAVFLFDLKSGTVKLNDLWLLGPFLMCVMCKVDPTTHFYGAGSVLSRRSRLRPSTNGDWDLSKAVSWRAYSGIKYSSLTLYGSQPKSLITLELMIFDFDVICLWAAKSLQNHDSVLEEKIKSVDAINRAP